MTLTYRVLRGNAAPVLSTLPTDSVQCIVTSPPFYGLRDYGHPDQIGLERTPAQFVARLVDVFAEARRVLKPDGTLWLNLGDSYAGGGCGARDPERWPKQSRNDHMPQHAKRQTGLKPKDLIGIPWRVAFALQEAGWWLRQDIIWSKPNPMPAPVTDRCVSAHEYLFLLAKSERYFFDHEAIQERGTGRDPGNKDGWVRPESISLGGPGQTQTKGYEWRNKRSVWTVAPTPFHGGHFATMPSTLIEPCILAGTKPGDTVLDPFCGSGTTGVVALAQGRSFVGVELNDEYAEMSERRLETTSPLFARAAP